MKDRFRSCKKRINETDNGKKRFGREAKKEQKKTGPKPRILTHRLQRALLHFNARVAHHLDPFLNFGAVEFVMCFGRGAGGFRTLFEQRLVDLGILQ